MTRTELYQILSDGENSGIEFKRDDVRPEQIAKELVAFLNFRGGKLLLGVENDGTITGLTRDNCEEWIMDTVFARYMHPRVIPFYEELQTEEGRIAIVTVEQGASKPYVVRANDREETFIRVGTTSRLATREQLLRMLQEGDPVFHMETMPVNGTSKDDVDIERLKWYYEKFYNDFPDNPAEQLKILLDLDLAKTTTRSEQNVLTIAGLLLFSEVPSRMLPQAGIRILSYPGSDVGLDSNMDRFIDGPIVSISDENGNTVKSGLFNQIMDTLQTLLSEEKLDNDGITRVRKWKYPKDVLREVIVNAFAHRDWTKNNTNRIEVFDNRVEITSAGALPNTLTVEKVLAGVQYPRNPILVRVFRDLGEMDDRGMGLRRKVIPTLKKEDFPDPKFEATEDYFKITIYRK